MGLRGLRAVYGSLKSPLVDPLPLFRVKLLSLDDSSLRSRSRTWRSLPKTSLPTTSETRMADASTNIGMTAIKPVGWDRSGCEAFKWTSFSSDFYLFLFLLCPTTYCHKSEVFTVISHIRTRLPGTFSTIPKLGRSSQELQSLGSRSSSSTASTTPA